MSKVIIMFGSTGETGKRALDKLIASNSISKIHLMNRRIQGIQHHKVLEHLIDFEQPNTFTNIPHADAVICTLGTTIKKAGSKEAFKQVDLHHVLAAANWAKQRSEHFIVVSSFGANPDSSNFYLKTKGDLERALIHMNWPQLSIFRPGLLLGKREEFRMMERLAGLLSGVMNIVLIGPLKSLKATKMDILANALVNVSTLPSSGTIIYKNPEIDKLGKYH